MENTTEASNTPSPGRSRKRGSSSSAHPLVLVATAFDEASAIALRRGYAMAEIIDAKVAVLHVVPPNSWINMLLPHRREHNEEATRQLLRTAIETTRAWCDEVLGPNVKKPEIILKRGHVASAIIAAARDVRASLIVIGDSPGSAGGLLGGRVDSTVIHDAGRPVLIARQERESGEILAATNLTDVRHPVLRQAARLGARLRSHVTFLHNVDSREYGVDYGGAAGVFGVPIPSPVVSRGPDLEQRKSRLQELAHFMGGDIETVLATENQSSEAIMEAARERDADLIVVGTKPRNSVTDLGSLGTAATVARDSQRSVLAVPVVGTEESKSVV